MTIQPALEVLEYLRAPALPGVELLSANPSLHSWRMLHERYLLCGCLSVSTSWVYRHRTRQIEDGMTAFMEPGEIHRVVAKGKPSHFLALFVEPEEFLKFAGEQGVSGTPHFSLTETKNASLLGRLSAFADCLGQGRNDLELQTHLTVLMYQAMEHTERRPSQNRLEGPGASRSLRIAREMLRLRYEENLSLGELSAASGLSRFHLVRCFTRRYGMAPHAYQIQLRVKRACRMLRAGVSCIETASTTGFADQSHFARHFRRVMGVTPRRYARGSGG